METDLGHNYTAAMEDLDDATQPAPPHDGLLSLQTAHLSHIYTVTHASKSAG